MTPRRLKVISIILLEVCPFDIFPHFVHALEVSLVDNAAIRALAFEATLHVTSWSDHSPHARLGGHVTSQCTCGKEKMQVKEDDYYIRHRRNPNRGVSVERAITQVTPTPDNWLSHQCPVSLNNRFILLIVLALGRRVCLSRVA